MTHTRWREARGAWALTGIVSLTSLLGSAASATVIADWAFSEAAGKTLNQTANTGAGLSGAGGTWDVAIAGVATTGSGQLGIRNNGGGGSGTRTTYADLGPVPSSFTSGTLSLYASFSGWNLPVGNAVAPGFTLAFIEGNDFSTAQFSLTAGASGLTLGATTDAAGNGTAVAQTAQFGTQGSTTMTVRLSVDLQALRYSLAYDAGAGFSVVGSGAVDSQTASINSLRLSLGGDYSGSGSGLWVDRIWVVDGPVSSVPEPVAASMMLSGLAAISAAWSARRRRLSAGSAGEAPDHAAGLAGRPGLSAR